MTALSFVWVHPLLSKTVDVTCELVSFLTNSGVGQGTICGKDGGFLVAGSVPTGNLTGLTTRIGWAPECVLSVVMGVSGLLAEV